MSNHYLTVLAPDCNYSIFKYKDISGILVAIDFEKAFDSLNLNFLLRVSGADPGF